MNGIDLSQYQLDRPYMLWVVVLAILFLLLRERGLTGWPRGRLFASALLRGFAFMALVLALTGPHRFDEQPDLSLVFVVDASGSSSGGRLAHYSDVLDDWWDRRGDVPARIVSSGEELSRFDTPGEFHKSVPAVHERTASDLGPALELALESFEPTSSKAVILLSDGAATGGRPDRAASVAAIRGVRIHAIPPDDGLLTVAASELDLGDATVLEGGDVRAELVVAATGATVGRVALLDSEGNVLVEREGVELVAGENRVPLSFVAHRQGVRQLEARVEVEGDLFDSDDVAYGAIEVVGTPRVLVAAEPEQARSFGKLLVGMQPALTYETTSTALAEPLDDVNLLIWIDPLIKDLPGDRAARLKEFVRGGGRLIVLGGANGLEISDEGQDDIKDLMPVRFPKTERKEPAPLVVIYCIDQSDSMGRAAKFDIALTAVVESIAMLDPEARVGVVTFSDLPRWAVPVVPAGEVDAIRARLSELSVHGGTSIYPALQLGYEALIDEEAKIKHLILLSDGRLVSTLKRDGQVVNNIALRDFTLSTVAIGSQADQPELKAVAELGQGRFYFTEDFSTIPQILLDETLTVVRSNKIEQRIDVHAVEDSRFLEGLDVETVPDLQGYVRSQQRTTSELALATERGEPLLLSWRHGRGAVTVFTSDFDGAWSTDWKDWDGRGRFWRNVVQETLSPLPAPEVGLEMAIHDDELRVQYSVLDALKNPRNNLVVEGELTAPNGRITRVELQPSGPGRYAAQIPVTEPGGYLASVAATDRRKGTLDAAGGVIPGGSVRASAGTEHAAETRAGTLNRALLQRLVDETGGRLDPTFEQVFEEGVDTRQVRVDSGPPLLWAGLVLLLVDIGIRRLRWPRLGKS